MNRALWLFEKQGIEVIPLKVDYKVARSMKTSIMDFLPDAEILKQKEKGIRELIGILIY